VVSSTLLLQRRVRVFLLVIFRKRVIRGATLLKAHFRGHKARHYVANLKYTLAVTIQKAYRRSIARRYYVNLRAASLILQRIIRGYHARCLRSKCITSILTLQRFFRGCLGRLAHFALKEAKVCVLLISGVNIHDLILCTTCS
jgi:hypothetical protein